MIPKPSPPPQAARVEILKKYARPSRDGKVMMCGQWGVPGKKLKVIFDTEQQAVDFAAELEQLPDGEPQRAYGCPRSRRGHYHLTSMNADPEGTEDQ
jgi:hypothetical protein